MSITAKTQLLAVLGDPVGHSLSPIMHNGWIADHGLDAVYVALQLKSVDAAARLRAMKDFSFKGANVTVPHKEAAAAAADFKHGIVSAVGVANTLAWGADGLHAHNTDFGGFGRALSEAAPDWRGRARALIIGAGGAARAVAYALSTQDAPRLTIVNRSLARAQELAAFLNSFNRYAVETADWSELEAAFAAADVIVNTTSLGMKGAALFDWPIAAARAGAIVCDIVYTPLETQLLRAARARGLATMDGLGMLIHQGALAFEIWFGILPDPAKARARLLGALGA